MSSFLPLGPDGWGQIVDEREVSIDKDLVPEPTLRIDRCSLRPRWMDCVRNINFKKCCCLSLIPTCRLRAYRRKPDSQSSPPDSVNVCTQQPNASVTASNVGKAPSFTTPRP